MLWHIPEDFVVANLFRNLGTYGHNISLSLGPIVGTHGIQHVIVNITYIDYRCFTHLHITYMAAIRYHFIIKYVHNKNNGHM